MNVLVINGSPRAKGNSDLLCDEFIRGAEESGNQVENNAIACGNPCQIRKWNPLLKQQVNQSGSSAAL